jgi:hypothetical protein
LSRALHVLAKAVAHAFLGRRRVCDMEVEVRPPCGSPNNPQSAR